MTPENFCYWLTGFVELTRGQTPDPAQWKAIREHLDLVFKKVTPAVESKVTVKVDTKDAQKAVEDLAKQWEEITRKTREMNPQPDWWKPPHTVTCTAGVAKGADGLTIC